MPLIMRKAVAAALVTTLLAGCSSTGAFSDFGIGFAELAAPEPKGAAQEAVTEAGDTTALAFVGGQQSADRTHINRLIDKYAARYDVPASLVHSVVRRESTYNPKARNGIHIGLMQLNPQTARTMGFRGNNADLYDPETNLKYGVKYLAGAYMVAKGNATRADKLYQTGYYYHAKRMGLLEETGLRS